MFLGPGSGSRQWVLSWSDKRNDKCNIRLWSQREYLRSGVAMRKFHETSDIRESVVVNDSVGN